MYIYIYMCVCVCVYVSVGGLKSEILLMEVIDYNIMGLTVLI